MPLTKLKKDKEKKHTLIKSIKTIPYLLENDRMQYKMLVPRVYASIKRNFIRLKLKSCKNTFSSKFYFKSINAHFLYEVLYVYDNSFM